MKWQTMILGGLLAIILWCRPAAADLVQNKFTATGTSTAVFGQSRSCYKVDLVADPANAGPVHWNYGTATTDSYPLQPTKGYRALPSAKYDGNVIEAIQGTGCSNNCVLWVVCQ